MEHAQDALCIEIAVGDQADDERGNDRAPALSREGLPDLAAGGGEGSAEEGAQRDEPSSPDEELEEHHDAESSGDRIQESPL